MKLHALPLTGLLTLGLMPCGPLALAAEPPKVVHDWPEYRGPNGQFGDTSKVPLADSMTAMTLLWESEEKEIGFGKSHSGYSRDIAFGGDLGPSGISSPIVAGGLVIMSYYTPSGDVINETYKPYYTEKNKLELWEQYKWKWKVAADDVVIGIDAATGKTRWKQVFAGAGLNGGSGKANVVGCTPLAHQGRVYALGSCGGLYCLDLATGKPVWQTPNEPDLEAAKKEALGKSGGSDKTPPTGWLMVHDDVLIVPLRTKHALRQGGITRGVSLADGSTLWEVPGHPGCLTYATIEGRKCLVNAGICIEAKTGKVLWQQNPEQDYFGPPVMAGNILVSYAPHPKSEKPGRFGILAGFQIDLTGAKKIWTLDERFNRELMYDAAAFRNIAVRDDLIYHVVHSCDDPSKGNPASTVAQIIRPADGKILASQPAAGLSLPFLWGDRLVVVGDTAHRPRTVSPEYWQLYTTDPENFEALGEPWLATGKHQATGGYCVQIHEPFADGLVFLRVFGGIRCYDLRASSGQATVDREIKAAGADAHAVISRLLSLATDADVQVREAAGRKLAVRVADGQASSRQAEVLPVLLRLTAENDPLLRRQLASALAAFGANALPSLAGASRQPNENVRSSVVEALGHLGGLDDPRIDDILVAALGETNPVLVETALNSVVKRTGKLDRYQPVLVKLIDAAERPVDRTALGTLLMLLPESTLPTPRPKKLEALLVDLMATGDAARGQRAVAAIRSLGDDEARRIFTSVLQEGDSTSATRLIRAVKGLGEMGGRGKPALPALEQALERWKNWKRMSTTLQAAIKAIQEANETGDGLTADQGVVKD